MPFSNNAWKCKPLRNYSDALMFFTRYPKPRSAIWAEHQRPIYIDELVSDNPLSRMKHYRLERGVVAGLGAAYFDLVLHDTSVIRYMEPDENNNRAVYLTYGGWATKMTRDFMAQHGWHYGQAFDTDNNERVAVPYNFAAKSSEWIDGQWLAKLTFNEGNKLIVEASNHMTVYKRVSSKDDKARRALMRDKLDVLCDMLWLSIQSMTDSMEEVIDNMHRYELASAFGAFGSAMNALSIVHRHVIHEAKHEFFDKTEDFTPNTIDALRALYMCTYHFIYGSRVRTDYTQAVKPTQDEVTRAVIGYVLDMFNIKNGTSYEALPKFMLERDFPSARAHFLRPQ